MIQLWAEVYDPSYTTRVADSDLKVIRASVERRLDGPGRVDIDVPVMHVDYTSRALGVLTSKRVVEVWYQESEYVDKRQVAAFVIDDVKFQRQADGIVLRVRGADTLSLLMNYTTSLGLSYDNQLVSTIVGDLLPSGWTYVNNSVSDTITARFDGTSVLKAIQSIFKNIGAHFRQDPDNFKRLMLSPFGADSGYRLVKLDGDKPTPVRDATVIPIVTIDINTDSTEIVNKIIPLSAGDGDSRGTLENSNRSSPYTIEDETGPDGRDIYYLRDAASVALYGEITKVLNFKKIAPIGTSDASLARTANYLYDAAAEWLTRRVDPITDVQVRVAQQRVNFSQGDKVTVEYVEMVNVAGSPLVIQDVNDLFWVMASRETYGEDGEQATLTLRSTDREKDDAGSDIVESIDSVEVFETGYKAAYNVWVAGPYEVVFAGSTGVVYLNIANDVLRVDNVTMILNTTEDFQAVIPVNAGYIYAQQTNFVASTGEFADFDVEVNGTQVGDDLGSSSSALNEYEIDITDEIVGAGSDGRGQHTIEFTPVTSVGPISVQFMIRAVILPGRVT